LPLRINQIVHKSNNRLDQDLALCEKQQVPMMITSLARARSSIRRRMAGAALSSTT